MSGKSIIYNLITLQFDKDQSKMLKVYHVSTCDNANNSACRNEGLHRKSDI